MTTQCNDGSYVETQNGASNNQTLTTPTISGGQASNVRIVGGRIVGAELENTVIGVDVAGIPILVGEALARAGDVAAALSGTQGRLTDCSGADLADGAQIATCAQMQAAIDARIAEVVGAAPAALDTLAEIDAQLQADETSAAALAVVVAGKQGALVGCDGLALAAGSQVPTCAEMNAADAATLAGAKAYSDAGDTALSAAIAGKQPTLTWATQAQVQAGTGAQNPIDPATLKAAFGAAVSWPCAAIVTGARAFFGRNDASFDAIRGVANGSGSGSGVYGAASGTGAGSGVYGVADGTGGGSGVIGLVNGPGAGSGVYGGVNGNGIGNGLIGRVDGTGIGSGALLIVNGSGNGDGARAKVNGAGSGSGVSAAVYGAGNGHGALLSVGARDTSQPALPDPTGTGYALYAANGTYGSRLTVAGFYRAGANTTYAVHANADIYTSAGMTAAGTVTAASFVTTSDERLKRDVREIPDKPAIEFSRRLRFVDFDKLRTVEPINSDYERTIGDWKRQVSELKSALSYSKQGNGNGRWEMEWPPSSYDDIKASLERLLSERPPEPDLSDKALTISHQAGVIAQEVEKLAADVGYGDWLISTDPDGYLRVDMQSLMVIVARGNQLRLAALEGA